MTHARISWLFVWLAGTYGCAQILSSDDFRTGGGKASGSGSATSASGAGGGGQAAVVAVASSGAGMGGATSASATAVSNVASASATMASSSASTSQAVSSSASGGPDPIKRAFVSESAFLANNIGSLAGANAICAAEAKDLGGKFQAWMSDGTTTQTCTDGILYRRLDGADVATCANLKLGKLSNALNVAVSKLPPTNLATYLMAWTGITGGGVKAFTNCNAWAGGGAGTIGLVNETSTKWTDNGSQQCDNASFAHVYCFEQ